MLHCKEVMPERHDGLHALVRYARIEGAAHGLGVFFLPGTGRLMQLLVLNSVRKNRVNLDSRCSGLFARGERKAAV